MSWSPAKATGCELFACQGEGHLPEISTGWVMTLLSPDTLSKLHKEVDVIALVAAPDVLAPVAPRPCMLSSALTRQKGSIICTRICMRQAGAADVV